MVRLSREQIVRRVELTNKLRDNQINISEAQELKALLDLEKSSAVNLNDMVALLAISFLMGAVLTFIEENSKKKKRKKFE